MNRRGFAVLVLCVFSIAPFVASAQVNIAQGEDVRCSIECAVAARNGRPCPGTVIACKVAIPGSNTVWGICMLSGCKGQTYTGLGGGSTGVGDIGGIVGQIFKGLLDKIMQPKPSSGGGGGGTPATAAGCTTYYTVTVPSSDPCATYVQPTSSSLLGGTSGTQGTASQALLDALNGGTQSSVNTALGIGGDGGTSTANVSDQILNQAANQNTNTVQQTQDANTNINTVLQTQGATTNTNQNQTTASSATGTLAVRAVSLQSGTQGNIELRGEGATVVANARDVEANTEVAGFYGGDTFGTTQPQGVVARMCQSRPWAGSIVSFVIPPSFFDSLCAWRGYQVGVPVPPPAQETVIIQQTTPAQNTAQPAPATVSTIPPEVDIWAVPARVTLGGRTSIFWNTKGVVSCNETSPDGSFNENSLSGGASTVPLSGPTTFTISCLTPDGTPVTDYVTVNLAI